MFAGHLDLKESPSNLEAADVRLGFLPCPLGFFATKESDYFGFIDLHMKSY